MGIIDKILRMIRRGATKSVERQVEREVYNRVDRQVGKAAHKVFRSPDQYASGGGVTASAPQQPYSETEYRYTGRSSRQLTAEDYGIRPEDASAEAMKLYAKAGTEPDEEKRLNNLEKAAALGNVDAQFAAAGINYKYYTDSGEYGYLEQAIAYYEDGAIRGHVGCMEMTGYLLSRYGDKATALDWLKRAEAAGSPYARDMLKELV